MPHKDFGYSAFVNGRETPWITPIYYNGISVN